MMLRTLLVLGVVALAGAPLQSQRRSDILTWEEIERLKGKGGTAYDAVLSLRPRWLEAREMVMTGRPDDMVAREAAHVYLDDVDKGGTDYLKTIPVELVLELRWLSANHAASRFGPTSVPGIVVTLKR